MTSRSRSGPDAVRLPTGVVGVAALFLPTLAGGRYGSSALVAWAYLWLLGIAAAATLFGLRRRVPEEQDVAGFAAASLGEAWRPLVTALYLVGFTVGQAAIALVAGVYVGVAGGG